MAEASQRVDHRSTAIGALSGNAGGLILGVALTAVIAAAAIAVAAIPGLGALSPMILSIAFGILIHNTVGTPAKAKRGVTFAMRRILRFGIILLGLQLTLTQIENIGWQAVGVIVVALASTFVLTKLLGKLIGVDRKLAELIAAGTSICGASAVIATNTVTDGSDEDVAYAVACVTVFGSTAMFLYPMLPALFRLDARAFGIWSGSSIHEIAQVVAAAFQDGRVAGQIATISKLTRVVMLAPTVLTLGIIASRRRGRGEADRAAAEQENGRPPIPWFVFGFLLLVGVNSVVQIPASPKHAIGIGTTFLLSMALAAMGLETDVRKLRQKGIRPLVLGAAAWLLIATISLALVKAMRF